MIDMNDYTEKYPWLSEENICDFPEGWFNAFGENLLEELDQAIKKEPDFIDNFQIIRIKEKFGELRIYVSQTTEEINQIIYKYMMLSSHICIMCGKPDVPMLNIGWISPFCKECFNKTSYAESNRGKLTYEQVADDEYEMPDSYTVTKFSKEFGDQKLTYNIKETTDAIRIRYKERTNN